MKILLDENLPGSLLVALQKVGHEVDSINRLHLKGIDNGTLYRQVAQKYDGDGVGPLHLDCLFG